MVAPANNRKLDVLVADDESIARDILQIHLESLGCGVQSAVDGNQALHVLEDGPGQIGLVIIDAVMPGPSARELYNRIRSVDPAVPVLICSAHSLNHPELRFISDEHLPFLPKPFTRDELLQTLHTLLSAQQAAKCGITRTLPLPDRPVEKAKSRPRPRPRKTRRRSE